jgi:hypothetical protein
MQIAKNANAKMQNAKMQNKMQIVNCALPSFSSRQNRLPRPPRAKSQQPTAPSPASSPI